MKNRHGFVSNSSSSSFIIAVKLGKRDPCDHCGRVDPNFEESCFKWREFRETELIASGYGDIVKSLSDTEQIYLDISDSEMKILNDNLAEYKDSNNWKLMFFDMDYDDVLASSVLYNLLESENAVLIYDAERKYKGKYNEK